MKELTTLEDLEYKDDPREYELIANSDVLRNAARERIEELKKDKMYYSIGTDNKNLISWIRHFFNLEE